MIPSPHWLLPVRAIFIFLKNITIPNIIDYQFQIKLAKFIIIYLNLKLIDKK
jgi:hypothetical protein